MKNISFFDIRRPPFSIHGLYAPLTEAQFRRVPVSVAVATSERVALRAAQPSGGRVRFATDSTMLWIKAVTNRTEQDFLNSPLLESGFDVYVDTARGPRFIGCTRPAFTEKHAYTFSIPLPHGKKELTLHMPICGELYELQIGLEEGSMLGAHKPYTYQKPIVFYGSSITQGCAASRPGNTYPAMLSRRFDLDFINLGFHGSCRGEQEIVDYMASLDMCAFVCDFDHNRSSAQKLESAHFNVYETIRKKHPDIPFYMISRPDFRFNKMDFDRRAVIMQSYLRAWRAGDENVFFIDGSAFFNRADLIDCTVDGGHPSDVGFEYMANAIGTVLENTLPFDKMK